MLRNLIVVAILIGTAKAQAFLFDANTFYFTDTFAPDGESAAYAYTNYDLRLGFAVNRKATFFAGWNYSGMTASSTSDGTTTQYVSAEMGPSFLYVFGKNKDWVISFSYNLVTTATYTPSGSSAQKWKGTTMKAYLGYNIEAGENWFLGPTISYYSATFNETIIDETTYSTTGNARSQIYPAFYFGYRY